MKITMVNRMFFAIALCVSMAIVEGCKSSTAIEVRSAASQQESTPVANVVGGEETDIKKIPAFNWDAVPVDLVLQAYADQVDKTYLKDPAVPNAAITLKSRDGQKMTQEEYLETIEIVLEMNGIHIEPYGEKFLRVLPIKNTAHEEIMAKRFGMTVEEFKKLTLEERKAKMKALRDK